MMIKSQIEGNGYVYEDSIAQTIVFLAKGIYQLLIGNVIEGLIYEDSSPTLGLIGLIIFSITILIAIAYAVICLVLVFGAFTIFPLIAAYTIFSDLFYTIKNSFIFNKKDPTIPLGTSKNDKIDHVKKLQTLGPKKFANWIIKEQNKRVN